jgi:hypothetical protein
MRCLQIVTKPVSDFPPRSSKHLCSNEETQMAARLRRHFEESFRGADKPRGLEELVG